MAESLEASVAWRWAEGSNRDRLERELKALIGRAWETDPPDFAPDEDPGDGTAALFAEAAADQADQEADPR